MRCFRCRRTSGLLVGDPSGPSRLICDVCLPHAGADGAAEAEPTEDRAGVLHKAGIKRLMEGNKPRRAPRVMTTESFGANRS